MFNSVSQGETRLPVVVGTGVGANSGGCGGWKKRWGRSGGKQRMCRSHRRETVCGVARLQVVEPGVRRGFHSSQAPSPRGQVKGFWRHVPAVWSGGEGQVRREPAGPLSMRPRAVWVPAAPFTGAVTLALSFPLRERGEGLAASGFPQDT